MNGLILDPRPNVIADRLAKVKNIIAVTGFKGGIGKSSLSSALSLALNERGFKTGLFDLDFSGASDHIILGVEGLFPREEKGLMPPYAHGVKFMTPAYFSMDKAIAVRGESVSNAVKELFTVTIWDELDFLILDMPPGVGDAAFEIMKFLPHSIVLPIETPCELSREVLKRSIKIYKDMGFKIMRPVQNMAEKKESGFYHQIFRDKHWPKAVGDIKKMMKTSFYKEVSLLAKKISPKKLSVKK